MSLTRTFYMPSPVMAGLLGRQNVCLIRQIYVEKRPPSILNRGIIWTDVHIKQVRANMTQKESDERAVQIDVASHEFSWLFTDAVELWHLGRKYSALLLLLCAVDALAKEVDPSNKYVGKRFRAYLKDRLPRHTQVENFNIRVPKRDDTFRLEYILYKYLRNPVVHEGAHLDVASPASFAVCLDWSDGAPSVKVANDNGRVVLGGVWIMDVLAGVVRDELAEALTRQSN